MICMTLGSFLGGVCATMSGLDRSGRRFGKRSDRDECSAVPGAGDCMAMGARAGDCRTIGVRAGCFIAAGLSLRAGCSGVAVAVVGAGKLFCVTGMGSGFGVRG